MPASYWTSKTINRRAALRVAAATGAGLAALSLAGCGGGGSKSSSPSSGATSGPVDSTKGKPGGLARGQMVNYPNTLLVGTGQANHMAGFSHSGLLEYRHGRPIVDPYDTSVDPDLAQALPEQPDEQTYVFKLKDARFHNGRTVTSEDVKYSFDRYQNWERSTVKASWSWLDRVETPDPKTAVVKTKTPYADGLLSMASYQTFIMAKEHEESPEADKKLMGSGPFIFVEATSPIAIRFKKNPDFYDKPYPYFDELEALGNTDDAKKVADFVSGQTHHSYAMNADLTAQIKRGRPDAVQWPTNFASHATHFRVDRPPFNDKRVRQALSMAVDRKTIRDGTSGGLGDDDQILSWVVRGWGFRKPADLGSAAKYWKFDPQAAKQLLSAAGITSPVEADFSHWDGTVIGQSFPDTATLSTAKWRELGIASPRDIIQTPQQASSTTQVGNYEGMYLWPSGIANQPLFGNNIRSYLWSPPEGVKAPTLNTSYINNSQLSGLVDKQLTQLKTDDRKLTLRQVEDILAEEQYWVTYSTYVSTYFSDPNLRNVQIPKFAFSGSRGYMKYWWWDKKP